MPCEYHKQSIINTILNGVDESRIESESREKTSDECDVQSNTEREYLEQLSSPFTSWLENIVKSVDERVASSDDGDRDNLMHNPIFANDLIRLCKIFPLWSGVTCDIFEIEEVTSSSANVESDFKNVKQFLADKIPCSVDVFVEEHIEMLRGATIEASQQHDYVTFIGNEKSKVKEVQGDNIEKPNQREIEQNQTENEQNATIASPENLQTVGQNQNIAETFGCRNGGEPGGAHRCIECDRAVHILPCCSISIGDEEGYGEKRLCNACASTRKASQCPISVSQAVSEMQYNETWNKTKPKKSSKYVKPAPNWNLNMNLQKKIKLGILQNGNLSKATFKINKKTVSLTNTCSFDSVCQVNDA